MKRRQALPLWQRILCGILCLAGSVALVWGLVSGTVHGLQSALSWLLGVVGACQFGRIAISRESRPRNPEFLPEPSDAVRRCVESGQRVAGIKAYRAQTGATLFEAESVLDGLDPGGGARQA